MMRVEILSPFKSSRHHIGGKGKGREGRPDSDIPKSMPRKGYETCFFYLHNNFSLTCYAK